MPYTFQGIQTMSSALEAFQSQIDITGENISNVDTPGYSRETVNLAESPVDPVTFGNTYDLGSGVTIESVTRIQNQFLQMSANSVASSLGMANMQASSSSDVNSVIGNPSDGGINTDLDSFFNAWSGLASDPTDANKLTVQQAGETLTNDISSAYEGMESLSQNDGQQVTSTLQNIQSDVNQIATLNQQILSDQASGGSPNALLDQRDQTVANLSSMINVTVTQGPSGAYDVSSGNLVLVNDSGAQTVPTQYNAANGTITDANGSYQVQSGQLAGLCDSINKISSYQGNLNNLADSLQSSVNSAYAGASDSSGNTGETFFSGTGASNFSLASGIQSNPDSILTGASGAAGDVGIANQIAGLASQPLTGLGNQTASDYYSQLVGQIGLDGSNANAAQSTQQGMSVQVQSQIQSVSGVNLDDEMSNLLQFQRSYQAAAQALSSMDQTTQNLLSTFQNM